MGWSVPAECLHTHVACTIRLFFQESVEQKYRKAFNRLNRKTFRKKFSDTNFLPRIIFYRCVRRVIYLECARGILAVYMCICIFAYVCVCARMYGPLLSPRAAWPSIRAGHSARLRWRQGERGGTMGGAENRQPPSCRTPTPTAMPTKTTKNTDDIADVRQPPFWHPSPRWVPRNFFQLFLVVPLQSIKP